MKGLRKDGRIEDERDLQRVTDSRKRPFGGPEKTDTKHRKETSGSETREKKCAVSGMT